MNTFYPFYFLNFFKINKSVPNIGTLLKLFLQMIVVRTNDNIVAIGQPETQNATLFDYATNVSRFCLEQTLESKQLSYN